MPPQISEDEASNVSEEVNPAKAESGRRKAAPVGEESLLLEPDTNEDEEDDDEEIGEDEYVVEAITNHLVDDETGEIKYEVKWEGYDEDSDKTWEPEENLETASKILKEYLAKIGGKTALLLQWAEKKAEVSEKKGKKRGRASSGTPQKGGNGTNAKRGRKNGVHPASSTPPASLREFEPPTGSWEEEVVGIDACEGNEGAVLVYLTWKGGQKTQHPLAQVYKRCPQKMLKFYESHLVFKKNDDGD